MLLFGRPHRRLHRRWIAFFVIGTLGSIAFYLYCARAAARWPGGSSLSGMLFGTAAGLLILFEFLLWPRKWPGVRAWRIGKAQTWMRAHIWLGLLTIPLIWLHSGFTWGGQLSTVLALLFIAVIASGLFGLALQQVLPRLMLNMVPAETIYSQIDHVSQQFVTDADDMIDAVCGREIQTSAVASDPEEMETHDIRRSTFVVVGAVRQVGKIQGKVLQTQVPVSSVPNAELLRSTYRTTIRPFLLEGPVSRSPLRHPERAEKLFEELRLRMDPAAYTAIDALKNWCDSRRQFHLQSRIHWWLHAWLSVHLPLSIALVLLMIVHIYVALKYW